MEYLAFCDGVHADGEDGECCGFGGDCSGVCWLAAALGVEYCFWGYEDVICVLCIFEEGPVFRVEICDGMDGFYLCFESVEGAVVLES